MGIDIQVQFFYVIEIFIYKKQNTNETNGNKYMQSVADTIHVSCCLMFTDNNTSTRVLISSIC